MQQWAWSQGTNQRWQIEPTSVGYYKLTAQHSGMVLDVKNDIGGGLQDGANVQQWWWTGGNNQQWSITDVGSDYYKLLAKHSGKALDVTGASTANGANIQQWADNGRCQQRWKVEEAPELNVALKTTVTASSSLEGSGWNMWRLVDGVHDTAGGNNGYTSAVPNGSNHTEWIEINFGMAKILRKVVLYPRNDSLWVGAGFPIDFKIQVWDGINWLDRVVQTNYPKPGNSGQTFTWGFSDYTNRIRIYATGLSKAAADYALQFAEIEVY